MLKLNAAEPFREATEIGTCWEPAGAALVMPVRAPLSLKVRLGVALLGSAGTGNFGKLTSGALEASNVDLSKELVNMIVAQRNYQSNAQTIKTQDQILNTLVNLR